MPDLRDLLQDMHDRGSTVRKQRKQNMSAQEIEVFGLVLQLLHQLFDALVLIKKQTVKSYRLVKYQVDLLVSSFPKTWQVSNQELNDIQLELRRLRYLVRTSFYITQRKF